MRLLMQLWLHVMNIAALQEGYVYKFGLHLVVFLFLLLLEKMCVSIQ